MLIHSKNEIADRVLSNSILVRCFLLYSTTSAFSSLRVTRTKHLIKPTQDFRPLILDASINTRYYKYHTFPSKKEDNDERSGMEKAFTNLNDLTSADLMDDTSMLADLLNSTTIDGKKVSESLPRSSLDTNSFSQDEVRLYQELYQELDNDDVERIYDDIMGEMEGGGVKSDADKEVISSSSGIGFASEKNKFKVINDVDGIGSLSETDQDQLIALDISPQDSDEFMQNALKEAMKEIKSNDDDIDPKLLQSSILKDEEIMKEINKVFDKANEKLLEEIQVIREEQAAMTRSTSEKREKLLQEEEAKLRVAENSVSKLVEQVKRETMEVENATKELELIQSQIGEDPLMQAVDLKKSGLVKQGAFVGAVLFTLRSIGDLAMVSEPDGVEHATAAAIQGFIAVACAAYLKFL